MKKWLFWLGVIAGVGALVKRVTRKPLVSLDDKVVLITGASSGIGRSTAHAFAAHGANIVLAARQEAPLVEVQNELAIYEVSTMIAPVDIAQDDDLTALVENTLNVFGRIDVLVNNAGRPFSGVFHDAAPARLRATIEAEMYGTMRLTQLVVPVMLRQGGGHIVNVSSIIGCVPVPGMVAYSAVKTGLVGFSDALRREVSDSGIRVSVVMPGQTRTASSEAGVEPEVPAACIVDAVRYGRREVLMGGPAMQIGSVLEWLAPRLLDLYFRWQFLPEVIDQMERRGN